ncbi:MAG: hypothetical protein MUD10_00580 [Candidatus Pacebacteria bacterium]|jgi:hypothetical protein|nr:hypothetical protein [Candidatus Paceibacterota bacterium]
MAELLIRILAVAYGSVGIIGIIAYWPTIRDLINKKPSANLSSYSIWVATNLVTFLYSLFVVDDLLFRLVSGAYLAVNTSVFLLRLRIK